MGVPASEMPRIGECPECETLDVAIILTETGEVLCSACGEDVGKPAVVEGPGYDSLWHLHPHEHTERDEEWGTGHQHGLEWAHTHNHRSNEWDEYSYHHHKVTIGEDIPTSKERLDPGRGAAAMDDWAGWEA